MGRSIAGVILEILGHLQTFVLCLLSWMAACCVLFIVLPILFLLALYKWLVNLSVRLRHPSATPLSALDISCAISMDLYKRDGKLLNNIGCVLLVDSDLGIQDVRREVEVRLLKAGLGNGKLKYPRLRQHVFSFMGHLYWSPEIRNIDISAVVKEGRMDGADFQSYINDWLQLGYADKCPLWEIMLFKDAGKFEGKTVVAFKMAHALGKHVNVRA